MKKIFFCIAITVAALNSFAQVNTAKSDTSWKKIYRVSYPKTNELVHTKLDVKFNFDKAWMYGKAWVTLQPHFYPTDSLTLDAKGMDIKEVAIPVLQHRVMVTPEREMEGISSAEIIKQIMDAVEIPR